MARRTRKDSWKKRRKTRFATNKATADAIAKKRGGRCLSSPRRVHDKWKWKCAKAEHKPWRATLAQVQGAGGKKGSWCPYCGGTAKVTKSTYEKWATRFGGRLVKMAKTVTKESTWRCKYHGNFDRSLNNMQNTGNFCPYCSSSLGERKCKAAMEKLFGKKFLKKRFRNLKGLGGKALELDLYNEELKLALEHQGAQHFIRKKYFKVHRLNQVMEHDRRKRRFCAANKITLIEIRQVGDVTPDSELKNAIRRALLKKKFPLPKNFDRVRLDLDAAALPTLAETKWEETKQEARSRKWKVTSPIYLGSLTPHKFVCNRGHAIEMKPSRILAGDGCWRCEEKPVVLSDGRCFTSTSKAAKTLGVTVSAVSSAISRNGRVRGLRAQFLRHTEFNALTGATNKEQRTQISRIFANLPEGPRIGEANGKPVLLGDGRVFPSAHAAARAVGVKPTIAVAAARRPKGKIRAIRIAQISKKQANAFKRSPSLIAKFWELRPLGPRKFMTRRRGILTSAKELFDGVREASEILGLTEVQVCDAARRGTEKKSRHFWYLSQSELRRAKKSRVLLADLLRRKQEVSPPAK